MMETTEGTVQKLAGKAQGAIGDVTGDMGTEFKGKVREMAGQAQESYGQALDLARDAAARNPIGALAIALAIGFIAGALMSTRR